MVTLKDFIHKLKSRKHLVQQNKQHSEKPEVVLGSFHLKGHNALTHDDVIHRPKSWNRFACVAQ